MKKYLLFCSVFGALLGANAWAYDVIKAEDEYLVKDIVKVNNDKYVVETQKNMEMLPVENLKQDETLVLDDAVIGESVRREVNNVYGADIVHPRDRYLNGEKASNVVKKPDAEPVKVETVEIVTDDGEVFIVDEEVTDNGSEFESEEDFVDAISECYDDRSDELKDAMALYDDGFRAGLGSVSQIMAEVNHCYEQIGYAIIAEYYDGSSYMMKNFDEESKKFYVTGSDVNFNGKFCDENCSVRAIMDAQIAKFADFRIYLTKLLTRK